MNRLFICLTTLLATGSLLTAYAAPNEQAPSSSTPPPPTTANSATRNVPLETVVITASPLATESDKIATIMGIVDRDAIVQSGGANLADALKDLPGVTGTGFASGASRPIIRGFSDSRVRVMENGINSFDVSDIGPDHGVPIDPLSTQRIEVVRGAATLRYGSQAIGGVVNAINNRVPRMLADDPVTGEGTTSYGSGNGARQFEGQIDARAGQFMIHADGFDRITENYDIPHGTQPNSYFKGDGYSLGSSYFFGESRIGAAIVHYDSNYGVPSDTTHIEMKQTKELVGSSFAIDAGALKTLTIDGGYGDYKHDEVEPNGTVDDTFLDKEFDSRAEAVFGAFGPFSAAALGAQLGRRDFSALGAGADYLSPTKTFTGAGFAYGEIPFNSALRLQVGARIERAHIEGTPASGVRVSRDFTPISGSAGVVYEPNSITTFGLTLTSAARFPAVTELFAHGPHDGPNTFETGDPTLRQERANSLEGTIRIHDNGTELEGSLWGVSFNNFIYGALSGRLCDDLTAPIACAVGGPGDLKELFYQQTGATFWGLEGKASTPLLDTGSGTLIANTKADYVRATLSSGGNVPRIPPYHLTGGLTWTTDTLTSGFSFTYSGRQDKTGTAETPTKSFVSLDAGITWRPFQADSGFEISLTGKNLTNRMQRNATALNRDDVVLPGRDVQLTLRYAF